MIPLSESNDRFSSRDPRNNHREKSIIGNERKDLFVCSEKGIKVVDHHRFRLQQWAISKGLLDDSDSVGVKKQSKSENSKNHQLPLDFDDLEKYVPDSTFALSLVKNSYQRNNNDSGRHGVSDTMPKPDDTKNTNSKTDEHPTNHFIDYLKFYGENLKGVSDHHEEMLVDLFLRLNFFRTIEHQKDKLDPIEVKKIDCHDQCRPGSAKKWDYYYRNAIGVRLYIRRSHDNFRIVDTLSLEFSGRPLSILIPRNNQLKVVEMIDFVSSLNKRVNTTRIDSTLEFDHNLLDFQGCLKAILNQDFSGVEETDIILGVNAKTGIKYPTLYLGAVKSRKRICMYETLVKHGYSAIRIEARSKDRNAKLVREVLRGIYNGIGSNEEKARSINNFIRDYTLSPSTFNFVDATSKKPWMKATDYRELPFWTQFKKDIGNQKIVYHLPKKQASIQRTMDWIDSKVSSTLNILNKCFGTEYLHHIIDCYVKIADTKKSAKSAENQLKKAQLKEMGFKAHVEMFSDDLRKKMKTVGFYDYQIYPDSWQSNNVIHFLDLAVKPAYHWEYNSF